MLQETLYWTIPIPDRKEIKTKQTTVSSEFTMTLEGQNPSNWRLEAHLVENKDWKNKDANSATTNGLSVFLRSCSASSINVCTDSVRFSIVEPDTKKFIKSSFVWNDHWKDLNWKENVVYGCRPLITTNELYANPTKYAKYYTDGRLHLIVEIYYSAKVEVKPNDDLSTDTDGPPAKKMKSDEVDVFSMLIEAPAEVRLKTSDGKKLKCDVEKLSAISEVFQEMLICDTTDHANIDIQVPDFNSYVVKEFLRFVYLGTVQNLDKHAIELIKFSVQYKVNGLYEIAMQMVKTNLKVSTVLETVILVQKHNIDKLFKECCKIIQMSYKFITTMEAWKNMNTNLKIEIFDCIADHSWLKNVKELK